jgi:hypothetical protein
VSDAQTPDLEVVREVLARGTALSEIKARGRLTNFCRACLPGGLMQF